MESYLRLLTSVTVFLLALLLLDPVKSGGFVDPDEEKKSPTRYQMVFVIDRTNSFDYFYDKLGNAIGKFSQHMREDFVGTEIAIVSYGGYTPEPLPVSKSPATANTKAAKTTAKNDAPLQEGSSPACTKYQPLVRVSVNPIYWTFMEPEEDEAEDKTLITVVHPPPPPSDTSKDKTKVPTTVIRDNCYTVEQKFTKNMENIASSIARIPREVHPNNTEAQEHALTAMWIAIQDESLGWSKSDIDPDGSDVKKIVILVTDSAPVVIPEGDSSADTPSSDDNTNRRRRKRYVLREKDDAPDNCQYTSAATAKSLSELLKMKSFYVTVAIPRQPKWTKNLMTIYSDILHKMGVRFDVAEYHAASEEDIMESMGDSIGRFQQLKPVPVKLDENGHEHYPASLQIALMLDRSSYFDEQFFTNLAVAIKPFFVDLQQRYESVEFAVVVFSDFTSNQWDHKTEEAVTQFSDSNSCYYVQIPFTSDTDAIVKAIQFIQLENNTGGDIASSDQLTALLLTMTDSTIGWKQDDEGGEEENEKEEKEKSAEEKEEGKSGEEKEHAGDDQEEATEDTTEKAEEEQEDQSLTTEQNINPTTMEQSTNPTTEQNINPTTEAAASEKVEEEAEEEEKKEEENEDEQNEEGNDKKGKTKVKKGKEDDESGEEKEKDEEEEKTHIKVVIFITETDSHAIIDQTVNKTGGFVDWENRNPAKGDGSDTCENAFLPPIALVGEALGAQKATVLGLVDPVKDPFILNKYAYYFNKLPVRYSLSEVNVRKMDELINSLISSFPLVLPIPVQDGKEEEEDESTTETESDGETTTVSPEEDTEATDIEPTEEAFPTTDSPPYMRLSTDSSESCQVGSDCNDVDPDEWEAILAKHYSLPTCDKSDPYCVDPDEDDDWDPPGYNTLGL